MMIFAVFSFTSKGEIINDLFLTLNFLGRQVKSDKGKY